MAAFNNVTSSLADASLLVDPTPDTPTSIMTNDSDIAIGAVLQQHMEGQWVWCPFAFFSQALKPAETCYSTYDREVLAIYIAIKHFRYFLEGRNFHVLTDHEPDLCLVI